MGDHGSDMLDRDQAIETALGVRESFLADRPRTSVGLVDAFEGRVLAEDVVAASDMPAASRATMDGFAIDASRDYPFEVVESEVFPEDEAPSIEAGQTVKVATGAAIPPSTNAVLKVEEATVTEGRLEGSDLEPGNYVSERGSNVTAGETLFEAGERLSAKDAILLRDLGRESVAVREPFDVGLLATGTEIHENRSRDLDSPMLASLVRTWGHEATIEGTVPDEYDRVESAIESIAAERDVVVTTGGTSVGKKDHVIRVLRTLGDLHFHRVADRPGKPIAVASLPDHDALAVAIPGKPVGAHTIATLVARPLFTGRTALPTVDAVASSTVDLPSPEFECAIPVTLRDDGEGRRLEARPLGQNGSPLSVYGRTFDPSVLSSSPRATRADGFVLTTTDVTEGETVDVVPYEALE
jgi:molybdopterin molybdotransferase